jgi:hypothetical protein
MGLWSWGGVWGGSRRIGDFSCGMGGLYDIWVLGLGGRWIRWLG